MVYANPVGHGTHCMQPVEWVGRWKFLKGWTKVWSCERHADELRGLGVLPHSATSLMAALVERVSGSLDLGVGVPLAPMLRQPGGVKHTRFATCPTVVASPLQFTRYWSLETACSAHSPRVDAGSGLASHVRMPS
jgi:hypothetical protein